jgi:adenylate cyclase
MPTILTDSQDYSSGLSKLVGSALANEPYESVFKTFCDDLADSGLPLLRINLAMHTLHPLVAAVDITWIRDHNSTINSYPHTEGDTEEFQRSPFYWMLSTQQRELRQDLRDKTAVNQFPLFHTLQELGGTEYLALITPFGDSKTVFEHKDGIVVSWVTDDPGGFSEHHINSIKFLQPYVALVAKLYKQQYTATNVVTAYLGEAVGRQVLEGQIRLGDVERIPAVIWLCDLRGSTTLAEQLTPDEYLQSLNAYFDCTAGAVLEHGGQVLSFIGDAVLAVFPVTEHVSLNQAAHKALAASKESNDRIKALNQNRKESSQSPMAFGLALHVGDVHFGNIGVPTRIEFSVIGRAVNEVSRLESLTKEVNEPVLVSRTFMEATDQSWRNLGAFNVKGVSEGMEIFAPTQLST